MAPEDVQNEVKLIFALAIANRATGTPAQAASQILAGFAVLEAGPEQPTVVLWPADISLEEQAAWHEKEAASFKGRALRLERRMRSFTSSAEKKSQDLAGSIEAEQVEGLSHPTRDEASELLNHLTAMIASVPLSRSQPAETPLQPDEFLECRQPSEAPSASTPAQTVPLFSDHRCQGEDLPQAPCPPIPAQCIRLAQTE